MAQQQATEQTTKVSLGFRLPKFSSKAKKNNKTSLAPGKSTSQMSNAVTHSGQGRLNIDVQQYSIQQSIYPPAPVIR